MVHRAGKKSVVVIIGPTAAGKTAAAECVASQIGGVILNADAQQVYCGLPLLTGQEGHTASDRLFSFLNLHEQFSAAAYAQMAVRAIDAAYAVGQIPMVVGGTGLYIDALLYERDTPPVPDPEIRERVAALSHKAARAQLCALDHDAPLFVALDNPRRVSRALEVMIQTGKPLRAFGTYERQRFDCAVFGLYPGAEIFKKNIVARVHDMWERGAVEEVRRARVAGYAADDPGMRAIGVREGCAFLDGVMTRDEAIAAHIRATWQYARRQMTWFRKMRGVTWYTTGEELCHSLRDFQHKNLRAS